MQSAVDDRHHVMAGSMMMKAHNNKACQGQLSSVFFGQTEINSHQGTEENSGDMSESSYEEVEGGMSV